MTEVPHLDSRPEDAQRQRAATKQSIYREVNERIEQLAGNAPSAVFVCECPQEQCDQRLSLTLAEYEQIRSRPNRFLVLDGHQSSELAEVIRTSNRYLLVEPLGAGAQIAEKLDPRTREVRQLERV